MSMLTMSAQNGTGTPETDSDVWLVLWQTSGDAATYHLNTSPRIKYRGGELWIISSEVEIAYPEADVRKFTLNKDLTDVEDAIGRRPQDGEQDLPFSLSHARPGSTVTIFDTDGRKLGSHTVGADGSLRYSLNNRPAGIYLIKTETTTIKIIKK